MQTVEEPSPWKHAKLGPEAFDLKGRKALVLGAGAGAGRAIALALAEAGADVAVSSATQNAAEVLAVKRLAQRIGVEDVRRSIAHAVDATLGTGVQVMVRQVVKDFGRIDILAVAPDLYLAKPAERISDPEWTRVLNLNLSAVFFACRAVGREMLKQEWSPDGPAGGRIITVASGLGERGLANSAAYCAAKGGVVNLTRALAQEWSPHNVTVNCIAPAWMEDTPGLGSPDPEANQLVRFIPMRRPGRDEEVGPLAVWLASDAASYVSGQTFFVDGGLLCHL